MRAGWQMRLAQQKAVGAHTHGMRGEGGGRGVGEGQARPAGVDAQRRQALRPRVQPRQVPERLPVPLAAHPRRTLSAGPAQVLSQTSEVPIFEYTLLDMQTLRLHGQAPGDPEETPATIVAGKPACFGQASLTDHIPQITATWQTNMQHHQQSTCSHVVLHSRGLQQEGCTSDPSPAAQTARAAPPRSQRSSRNPT